MNSIIEAWNFGLREGDIIRDIDDQGRLDASALLAVLAQFKCAQIMSSSRIRSLQSERSDRHLQGS